ncbi:winged helix-turn-helix transcriptional regulator [Streptomyces endocoffeicus]|uniref:winged helix-turn-helix transcriptional regulator n=1 Tax=Streptomyces endocoffeicus TaxID=2898945 RepID=UPI003557BDE9
MGSTQVGGQWKYLVVWQLASERPRRFGQLRRLVNGVTEKVLIGALKELEADGIIVRKDFREVPPHVEYSLTPFGVSLAEALRPLCEWAPRRSTRRRYDSECREIYLVAHTETPWFCRRLGLLDSDQGWSVRCAS